MDECGCGEAECGYLALGYPYCRPCGEHHRLPECPIDSEGRPLSMCGCAYSVLEAADYDPAAHYAASCYIVEERAEASPARLC